jgi:hypothetical protein
LSLSLTNSTHLSSACFRQNEGVLSHNAASSLQQLVQMNALLLIPAASILSNWTSIHLTNSEILKSTVKASTELGHQIIGGLSRLFSHVLPSYNEKNEKNPTKNNPTLSLNPSCAIGALALTSGQPVLQFAGISLLSNCIQFPGVDANHTFLTVAGLKGDETPWSVYPTSDGGNIIGGQINSTFNAGDLDGFLTRFDSQGKEMWTTLFGGSSLDRIYAVEETPDRGYLSTGFTYYNNLAAVWKTKFFQNGTRNWTKISECTTHEGAYSHKVFPNGNFVLAGFTARNAGRSLDLLLIMCNPEGNPIWSTTSGGAGNEIARAVIARNNGGVAVAGYTQSSPSSDWDLLIELMSQDGNVTCAVLVGGSGDDHGVALTEIPNDNEIAVLGYSNSVGGKNNILVVKIDSNCTKKWISAFSGSGPAIGSGIIAQDGKLLITGSVSGYSEGSGLIAELNAEDGTVSWAAVNRDFVGTSIQNTTNGGSVVTGPFYSPENQGTDLFLLQLEKGRSLRCNEKFITLNYTNLTDILNFTPFSSIITHPNITFNDVNMTFSTHRMNQTQLCPRNSSTVSPSAERSRSNSLSPLFSSSLSPTLRNTLTSSPLGSSTLRDSLSASQSHSRSLEKTDTKIDTKTNSRERSKTKQRTKTAQIQLSSSTLIEQSRLALTGVAGIQLSSSGSLILSKTGNGFKLVTVNAAGAMNAAGVFSSMGNARAYDFSRNEKYVFVALDQGNIEVVDISYPELPRSLGLFSVGYTVDSLRVSGSGDELLVGTNVGLLAFSIKNPSDLKSIKWVGSYPTIGNVKSIEANPNTNTIAFGAGKNVTLLNFVNRNFTLVDQKTFGRDVKALAPIDQINPNQLICTLDNHDLALIDLANLGTHSTILSGSTDEIAALSGTTLLVAEVNKGIQIFENEGKNWLTAREVGFNPINNVVTDLVFSLDGRFAVYSDSEGLKLIKVVREPGRLDVPLPRLAEVIKREFPINCALYNEGNNWIAVGGKNRLEFLDHSDRNKRLGSVNVTGEMKQMVFFPDKTKLLFRDENGISCINCLNPLAPTVFSRWNTASMLNGFSLIGSHIYACQEDGMTVLDAANLKEVAKIPTQDAAQTVIADRNNFYVADRSGIDIWSMLSPVSFQKMNRINQTGFVSHLAYNETDKTLYYASEQFLGKVNVSNIRNPQLLSRLDTTFPIRDITLSRKGKAGYVASEINGLLAVDTENMQIKGTLRSTQANSMELLDSEKQIFVSDREGGLKIVDLISELPIIVMTGRTQYPVAIPVVENLLFFDRELKPIKVERINEVKYLDQGQKKELPLWISADLTQGKLTITAPKELTDKTMQLAISLDVGGVQQETIYETKIVSSLQINGDKGAVSLQTPSNIATVGINLTGASFMPQAVGPLAVSTSGNILQASGPVSALNDYLSTVRINPTPLSIPASAVALNTAQISASDIINLFPSNSVVRLRNFQFNQPPVVLNPMQAAHKKALDSFEVTIPENTFFDPDDFKLSFSAQLSNGTSLPSWLEFDPETGIFNGYAPPSMLNQTIPITLTATDGYLSVNTSWTLHIDANHGPYVAKPIPSQNFESSSEFTYVVPKDIFRDLDNNTLTYTAAEVGYEILPNFLKFYPETCTFLGRPLSDDVKSYSIKLTATDKFGASASVIFDLNIEYSWLDLYKTLKDNGGYIAGIVTPLAALTGAVVYNRAFIYNALQRKKYWRNQIPEDLLKGEEYKPKCPVTEKEIEKDEIAKIRVLKFDQQKRFHEFTKDHLPTHFYVSLFGFTLLNDTPLPSWLELNEETGKLVLKKELFPSQNNLYVYQVIGKNQRILESFFIEPSRISAYEAPNNLADFEPQLNEAHSSTPQIVHTPQQSGQALQTSSHEVQFETQTLPANRATIDTVLNDPFFQEMFEIKPGENGSMPSRKANDSPFRVLFDDSTTSLLEDEKKPEEEEILSSQQMKGSVTLKRTKELKKILETAAL